MPLLHNFGWVGSFLLATLLATNWFFSPQIAAAPLTDVPLDQKVHIGIHTDHKWPERVVLDTTRSTAAHDAKGDGQSDVGGNEAAVLAERPFEAFAEMAHPKGRVFEPCSIQGAGRDPAPIKKGPPSNVTRACR